MKALLALAVMLSSLAVVGVATTSPAEAHFKKKHHHHHHHKFYKHYKHKHHKHGHWKHKKCHWH